MAKKDVKANKNVKENKNENIKKSNLANTKTISK